MPSMVRLRELDSRAWSTATWTAPFTTQLVLGALITISWLLGKHLSDTHEFRLFLIGTAVTIFLTAVTAILLLTSKSSRAHGLAVSVVGSSAVVIVGAVVYGFWIMQW